MIMESAESRPFAVEHDFPVPAADLERLRDRLAVSAQADGMLEIAYRVIDSPVGPLLLAATEQGLLRVAFEREDHDHVLVALSAAVSPRILAAPARLDSAARELDEYFARRRQQFDLPLDLQLSRGFRREVLDELRKINYGQTLSYAEVATAAGRPRAVRAVGTACATNPLPLVIPCHRVLRSDGGVGGYLGGVESKELLLIMEGAAA